MKSRILALLVLLKEDFIFLQLDFHGAAVEIEVVHHRTARWDKDSHAESQASPGEAASKQARQRQPVSLFYIIGWLNTNQGMSSRLIMFDLFDHMDF